MRKLEERSQVTSQDAHISVKRWLLARQVNGSDPSTSVFPSLETTGEGLSIAEPVDRGCLEAGLHETQPECG